MRQLAIASLLLLAACASQPVSRAPDPPLSTVLVNTEQYLGLWHEAALLPNRFQRDCAGSTAEYARRPDGLISVHNVCRRADGSTRDIWGRARRTDAEQGKLEVSFFGPFWADYWVLQRAADYSWSIVGEPSGRYLWVLTRAERITPEQRRDFSERLQALGYDVDRVIWR